MVNLFYFFILLVAASTFPGSAPAHAQEASAQEKKPVLKEALICEDIRNSSPHNPGVVFSISENRSVCSFTAFDPVYKTGFTIHAWYRKEKLIRAPRLTLKPPKWNTYSRVQLRRADIGPWRVEILDENNRLLKVLRFSVTE